MLIFIVSLIITITSIIFLFKTVYKKNNNNINNNNKINENQNNNYNNNDIEKIKDIKKEKSILNNNDPANNDLKYKEEFNKFLNKFSKNQEYGYKDNLIDNELRNHYNKKDDTIDQFPKLKDIVYLDHAASTLASINQIEDISKEINNSMFCNPHSVNPIGLKTKEEVDSIREMILNYFNAPYKQYSVIFTSGCTDSLKKVGEYFSWSKKSKFYYSLESHNSLLGIREYACEKIGSSTTSFQPIPSLYFKCNNDQFNDILEIIGNNYNDTIENNNNNNNNNKNNESYSLFGYPGQCNYSGTKYPLELINRIQKKYPKCKVLLDAASLVSTSSFDLTKYPVDFMTISFYKMFGYPTGIGALIVKNDSGEKCLINKKYFSGGTVNASMAQERFHIDRPSLVERLEDGTINFMNIISLKHGFNIINNQLGGIDNVKLHTFALTQYCKEEMLKLYHDNINNNNNNNSNNNNNNDSNQQQKQQLCIIYSDNHFKDSSKQGSIINFNIFRSNGELFGYNEVEKLASLSSIYLRTGCFCNPGACHGYLNLSKKDIEQHLKDGHVCWDSKDILNGKPTGSVRISFGYMNNFNDVYKFINFLKSNFINDHRFEKEIIKLNNNNNNNKLKYNLSGDISDSGSISSGSSDSSGSGIEDYEVQYSNIKEEKEIGNLINEKGDEVLLSEIYIYPVKSCSGHRVVNDKWELVPSGLKYDREWTIIDQNGNYINQKKLPILALIQTEIDLINDKLILTAPEMKVLSIPLSYYPISAFDQIQVCGDKVDGLLYGDKDFSNSSGGSGNIDNISEWLYQFTGKKCYLVRKSPESHRKSKVDSSNEISFANESPYLLINEESVKDLKKRIIKDNPDSVPSDWNWISKHSFRANFIITGGNAYQEDLWSQFQLISKQNDTQSSPSSSSSLIFNSVGDCNRCKMICINQKMGIEEREPLSTLASYRRSSGKIIFGQHLNLADSIKRNSTHSNDTALGSNESSISASNTIFLHVPSKLKVLSERY
ncbi:hypothetical protein ACTFIU_008814 [Dictyostelium citrinum]